MTVDECGVYFAVGAGNYDDGVLAALGEKDRRQSGGAGYRLHSFGAHTCASQIFKQGWSVHILAHFADHLHGIAETRRGDGLVCAFAAGSGAEAGTDHSLTDTRNLWSQGHHIHGDAADDDDGFA